MSERRARARRYHQAIHHILLHEWDPIGVADEPEAHYEYDSHIPKVRGMLVCHVPRERLVDHHVRGWHPERPRNHSECPDKYTLCSRLPSDVESALVIG